MDKNLRESVNVTSQKDVIMQKKPINILVTEDDIRGNEIPKMTNFIGNFINEGNIYGNNGSGTNKNQVAFGFNNFDSSSNNIF